MNILPPEHSSPGPQTLGSVPLIPFCPSLPRPAFPLGSSRSPVRIFLSLCRRPGSPPQEPAYRGRQGPRTWRRLGSSTVCRRPWRKTAGAHSCGAPGPAGRRERQAETAVRGASAGQLMRHKAPSLIPRPPPSTMPSSGVPGHPCSLHPVAIPQNPCLCRGSPTPASCHEVLCPLPTVRTAPPVGTAPACRHLSLSLSIYAATCSGSLTRSHPVHNFPHYLLDFFLAFKDSLKTVSHPHLLSVSSPAACHPLLSLFLKKAASIPCLSPASTQPSAQCTHSAPRTPSLETSLSKINNNLLVAQPRGNSQAPISLPTSAASGQLTSSSFLKPSV